MPQPLRGRRPLPSISIIKDALEYRDVIKLYDKIGPKGIIKLSLYLKEIFLDFIDEYDYILIDTRSGTDIISLFPVLFSDYYTLEDAINEYIKELNNFKIQRKEYDYKFKEPYFKGFIINEATTLMTNNILTFLEQNVFRGRPCLAIINYD